MCFLANLLITKLIILTLHKSLFQLYLFQSTLITQHSQLQYRAHL